MGKSDKPSKEKRESIPSADSGSSAKAEFEHESLQDRESIVRYLNALSQGIASGQLTLGTREESLVLHPSGLLKLSVKARGKDERTKLVFKISWKENGHGENPIVPESIDLPFVRGTKN
jgi:amphi-Trp domain-containing protein